MKHKAAAEKTQPACTRKRPASALKEQPATAEFQINVVFASKGFMFPVLAYHEIDTVRNQVSKQFGMECTFLTKWIGLPLPGNLTLGECVITENDVLIMHHIMQIFIELVGVRSFTMDVEPHEHIETIKERIQKKEGISASMQELSFNGTSLHEGPVSGYNIQHGSLLHVSRIFRVWVQTVQTLDPTNFSVVIQERAPISQVMQQISDCAGWTCKELWYGTKELHLTPDKTITACGIGEDSKLRIA
jgi:hypothetical protein